MEHPEVRAFFESETWTMTYVVFDPTSRDAIVIDPVLNYDALVSQTGTSSVKEVMAFIEEAALRPRAVLETHAHADHLSAGAYLAGHYQVPFAIGEGIPKVQDTFGKIFDLPASVPRDGSQFDLLLKGGATYQFGSIEMTSLATPGHTPACQSFLIGDAVFTGDALFMPDFGTGRTDFPAGSAEDLYRSVHDVLYALPEETRVFVGHDYQPGGRELEFMSTIGEEREKNIQLKASTSLDEFVAFREARDKGLRPPRLIYQSIQVNVFGGRLPHEGQNGVRYLKMPLNVNCPTDEAGVPQDENCLGDAPQAAE